MKTVKFIILFITTISSILTYAIDVTFRVDMSQQTVPPEGVHIAGSFQGWEPGSTIMSLESGTIYTYTTSFEAGEYIEYKFINGDAWGEDESVPPSCNQNNNRFLTVPEINVILDAVCFGSCQPCGDPADVTFQVDMSEQLVSAMGVHIAGSFQGWNAGSTELSLIENNIYGITITVSENDMLEFKYINGNDWSGEETVPANCGVPNGVGGFNRSYTVPFGGATLPVVCFSSCDPCDFIPTEVEVTFRIDMSEEAVSPEGVHIVGAFQEWDPAADEMTEFGNSVYEATFTLIAGNYYQYKFINGNTWEDEEIVPAECGVDNGQGGYNRFIDVPEEDIVLEDVCYSSCDPCSVGTGENFGSLIDPGFIAISPNPFTNNLKIQYTLTEHADVKISIINIYGQILFDSRLEKLDSGEYVYNPAIQSLSKGIYFCKLEVISDKRIFTELKKIIKQ